MGAISSPAITPTITPTRIFLFILALRISNALAVRTFFQPDEYFQSLEPAWHAAFGSSSGAWITWEWKYFLRSSLHPTLFASVYRLVDFLFVLFPLSVDLRLKALLYAPKLLQALFAAMGDFYTWKLACRVYGRSNASQATLFMTLLNPWQWYCSVRTFSNSLEMSITTVALALWPWELLTEPSNLGIKENFKRHISPISTGQLRVSLFLAGIAVLLRPTNILIWVTVLLATLFHSRSVASLTKLVCEIVVFGSLALVVSVASDRFFFGDWVFPPFQWLYFNLNRDLAVFYGRNDVAYYLVQGIPLLTTTQLPFVLYGLYQACKGRLGNVAHALALTVFTTCGALTLVSHKEVRFIYPLLPALHVVAAPFVVRFLAGDRAPMGASTVWGRPIIRKYLLALGILVNLIVGGYLGSGHQKAAISVLDFIRNEYTASHPAVLPALSSSSGIEDGFVLFLMPCHTTPWRSHLLYPTLNARALSCEPPLHTAPNTPERDGYLDESDRFYGSPSKFLGEEMWPRGGNWTIPRYIAGFEGIKPWIEEFLASEEGSHVDINLNEAWRGWNGLFNEDWRRSGDIVVWSTGRG
ncbi:GPI mannosyltransferase 3 [Ceratocystis fimbriata CBS 114723]|uniref:Mannosyltransferase n=1 Tax=Ceratocystis fimbriata CBS 114723 TaxID=1035309 RepID=A0A2C5X100_9PEZI|nr:GPI mannosyltransferase 3 [Ceratocystis fimbriata CBS 114723]